MLCADCLGLFASFLRTANTQQGNGGNEKSIGLICKCHDDVLLVSVLRLAGGFTIASPAKGPTHNRSREKTKIPSGGIRAPELAKLDYFSGGAGIPPLQTQPATARANPLPAICGARNRPVSEKAPTFRAAAKYRIGEKKKVSANIVSRTCLPWFRISATDGIICAVLE
jgi:hypothetical protein